MNYIGLKVAGLEYWLDGRTAGRMVEIPPSHIPFLNTAPPQGGLVFNIHDGRLPEKDGWRALYYPSDTWELWRDDRDRFIFIAPSSSPPQRYAAVDAAFTAGEAFVDLSGLPESAPIPYPLLNIEIKFFLNWLAASGDVVLHAVGVEAGGKGYCFAGQSGAGKSTLGRALAKVPDLTMLGEDNLVLRYQEGRFWIYGTPWHQDPGMCSPTGAPLEKLFFLDRSGLEGAAPLGPLEGVSRLLKTAFIPYYRPDALPVLLERLSLLAGQIPFFTLNYRLGSEPWHTICTE